jgi:unsaturated chondroitin disaccharide hydrolase
VSSNSVFKGFLFWYGAHLGAILLADKEAQVLASAGTRSLVDMYNARARLIPLGLEAEEASSVGTHEANIDALPGTAALLLSHEPTLNSAEIGRQHLRQHIALCVRDDGSVCQSATFHPENGSLIRRYTHKGIHDSSTWGRAQAWAMLGLAQALSHGEKRSRPMPFGSRTGGWRTRRRTVWLSGTSTTLPYLTPTGTHRPRRLPPPACSSSLR